MSVARSDAPTKTAHAAPLMPVVHWDAEFFSAEAKNNYSSDYMNGITEKFGPFTKVAASHTLMANLQTAFYNCFQMNDLSKFCGDNRTIFTLTA